MAADQSWIPETLKTILSKSESHYRSVGFKRTAFLMNQTLLSAEMGRIPDDFYEKYVLRLRDDGMSYHISDIEISFHLSHGKSVQSFPREN